MQNTFLIETAGGTVITPQSEGWRVFDVNITDITTTHERHNVPGAAGVIPMGTEIGVREGITLVFDFYATSQSDFQSKRSRIQSIFNAGPLMLFLSTPGNLRGNGSYLLVDKDSVEIEKLHTFKKSRVTVTLSSHRLPYFETPGIYTTTISGSGVFHNPGDAVLDNRYTDTEIEIRPNRSTSSLTVKANSNKWVYNDNVFAGDYFTMKDGDFMLGDSYSVFDKSTHDVLTLNPGDNTISAPGSTVIIKTKYYYI